MGDLHIWSPLPNGTSIEDHLFPLPSLASGNPDPVSVDADCWLRAEQTSQGIIYQIQPTLLSEQRRNVVVEYVQRLIGGYLGSEVCPFGSVPLKTYLPDGDIDLTALSFQNVEDALANDVRLVLEGEEQNKAAEFEVRDVQYINAEVKLVKCLVQNIVVDISFNQIGGLCTLCFLEQVNSLIGKEHLFKRSIILIKAWCYYESRILGAHHGLISTYALETLVLYIFHVFHSSLNGPLAVLYRFLDYYSKFDWDNYCISLNGPVSLTSLPEIVAETPEIGGGDLLLSKEFLKNCVDMYSVSSKGLDSRTFPQKHLNIVDPLKENNNLGRSVSKGNFYRIRSAFSYGARKLGRILLLPGESIADELNKFFQNTLDRHGSGQRPDVQDPVPPFCVYRSDDAFGKLSSEKYAASKMVLVSQASDANVVVGESMADLHGSIRKGIRDINVSGNERNPDIGSNKADKRCNEAGSSKAMLERDGFPNEDPVSGIHLVGDAEDLVNVRAHSLRIETGVTISTSPCSESDYSNSSSANINVGGGDRDLTHGTNSEDNLNPELFCNGYRELEKPETNGNFLPSNNLSDLGGDYESHLNSLLHARWYSEYGHRGSVLPRKSPPLPQFPNKHGLDNLHRPIQKQNIFCHLNGKNVISGPQFYSTNSSVPSMVSGAAFGAEDMPKPRGTGTYFPNTNYFSYRDRSHFPVKGRNPAAANHGYLPRSPRDNGRVVTQQEKNLLEKGSSNDQAQKHLPVLRELPNSNGFSHSDQPELGAFGNHLPLGSTPLPDLGKKLAYSSAVSTPSTQRPQPPLIVDAEKVTIQPYHMKEDDFPPLSV